MKRLFWLVAWLAVITPAFGVGLIIVPDATWWPGPIPPRPVPPWPPHPVPHPFAPLEVASVKAQARITDQLAVTTVDEEFFNPNDVRLEGTFVFPIPKGAHLDKFSMEIDGKRAEAELLAADKARGLYEDIVRKLRDPALLEYAERDLFKVRIFPIEPHSRKRVTLTYTQLLKADNGLIGYTLPLDTDRFSAKPIKSLSVQVELRTRRPLKTIYSPSHTVELKREGPAAAVATYEATDAQADADFALYFAAEKDELGVNVLAHKRSGDHGYFLLLASPGVDVQPKAVLPKDIIFVLDTSGSMAGKKLEQAKKALLFCIENLNAHDRFELLRFSTEVEPLFNQLTEATQSNREKANEFIRALKPLGGTALDDALKQALGCVRASDGRTSVIIFLTDGQPTIGVTDEPRILEDVAQANSGRTRIFCFGIGTDVNTHLLDRITENTRAVSQYVLPEEDLELKVSSFFSKINEPVLANPTIRFTGAVRPTALYPSPLPDLFKGEQLVLVGQYSGHGSVTAILEGAINGTTRQFTYELDLPEDSAEYDFIPRLWATRRVGYLLDEIRLHGENSELKDEAADLARKYGIVTPYTAYLILEDETRREVPAQWRSLRQFDKDSSARDEAAQVWRGYQSTVAGGAAIAGVRSSLALKSADAPAPAAAGGALEYQRAFGMSGSGGSQSAPGRLVEYARHSRFVGGKTFFQNENQWVDAELQKSPNAPVKRLQFGSADYFDFAGRNPQALAWLALGQNVQFLYENSRYEVSE